MKSFLLFFSFYFSLHLAVLKKADQSSMLGLPLFCFLGWLMCVLLSFLFFDEHNSEF